MPLKRKADTSTTTSDAKKPKNATITSFFGPPKSISVSRTPAGEAKKAEIAKQPEEPQVVLAGKGFDKKKWTEKLTPEQRDLLGLEIETLHESWLAHLKDELVSKEFLELKRFLKREHEAGKKIFPPCEDVYSWSRHCPLNTVKAVILGQDPYHNHNQAHGMCFSVRPPTSAPPSLKNIYICLAKDIPGFKPPPNNGGLLTPWADRGVLLLNACLTVRAHEPNSHANRGWEKFTQKVIDLVAERRKKGVVFLAWGAPAAKRVAKVDKTRHCVLLAAHPSPLSAHRGFFDCGHFRKANEWLEGRYGEDGAIDWSLDVDPKKVGVKFGTGKKVEEVMDAVPEIVGV